MKNPILNIGSVGASKNYKTGAIQLVNARGFSATASLKYPSSGGASATLKAYYSPDGENYDTLDYIDGVGVITLTADARVQITVFIDVPPHGWLKLELSSGASTTDATDGKIWYSIDSYKDTGKVEAGNPFKGFE